MYVPEFVAHEERYYIDEFFCNWAFRASSIYLVLENASVFDCTRFGDASGTFVTVSIPLTGSLSIDFSE